MPDAIRLGLIGCGHWGGNYASAIRNVDGVTLAWCADTSETARERARALHPHVRLTADFHEILGAGDCDAAIVAAPPSEHATIARASLAARKHVLVEKPLATDLSVALELVAQARDAGVVAMSGHVYHFHPVTREIVRRIRSGTTGRLRFMNASRAFTRFASSDDRSDVDALWDLAPNDLAMFVEFAGALPERVFCERSTFFRAGQADGVFALLAFPNNIVGELRVTWDYPIRERLVTVVGASESLRFDDDAAVKLLRYSGPPVDAMGRRAEPVTCSSEFALNEQIRHFADCVRSGAPTRTPFAFGLEIVRILEALTESAATAMPVRLA